MVQKKSVINTVKFGLKSPSHFAILANKFWARIFAYQGTLSKEANLEWIKSHCVDYQQFFSNKDNQLWQESLEYAQSMKMKVESLPQAKLEGVGGGGMHPILYFLTRSAKPDCIVETGVAAGFSSQAFLQAIERNGHGIIYSSDLPYFRLDNPENRIGMMVDDRLKKQWRLFVEGDRVNIPKIKKEIGAKKIGMFHYDSDKSYQGRAFALAQLQGLFSKDALVIFDDIQDNSHFYDYVTDRQMNGNSFRIFEFEQKYVGIVGL